MQMNSRRFLTC